MGNHAGFAAVAVIEEGVLNDVLAAYYNEDAFPKNIQVEVDVDGTSVAVQAALGEL